MDGLSAAASGVAVVSLALQLVGSVRDIHRFLRQVSESPKELKRLIDLLEQLELVLQNIGMLVESQRKHNGNGDVDVSPSVLGAIEACKNKVAILERVVETAKKHSFITNKTTRTLGSFKLACKKREIEEFESQLHDAVSLLNLAMTANLTTIYYKGMEQLLSKVITTNRIATTITHELFLLRGGPASRAEKNSSGAHARVRESNKSPGRSRGVKISKSQSTTCSLYTSLFGKLLVRRTIQFASFDDNDEILIAAPYTKSESTWAFVPSFLSVCINYQYVNACGFIQRSIRTYPYLPRDHRIWNLCCNGDLKGIQTLLSEGQVSPFSVDRWGNTLLHEATIYSKVETCRFLFNVGLNGAKANNSGHRPRMQLLFGPCDIPDFRNTNALFTSRCDDMDATTHCYELFSQDYFQPTVQTFNDIVNEFASEVTVNKFRETPIPMAMRMLWSSDPALYDEWKKIIHHVIDLGADLYKSYRIGATLLDDVMNLVGRPFESVYLGKEWLDVLFRSNVDLVEYLRTEFRLHFDELESLPMLSPDFRSDFRPRYLVISKKIPSVSWEWLIDPEGHAFDLLEEFKDFGPIGSHYLYIGYLDEEDKEPIEEEDQNWPFFYPVWHDRLGRGWQDPETLSLGRVVKARFENRRRKKAMKLARARGIRRVPKVPGSWID